MHLLLYGIYAAESLGKKNQTFDMCLCVNSKILENGYIARWYLASNKCDLNQDIMVEKYTTRFWIEEGIKDVKSKLHLEKYTEKIPQRERLKKCIIISCLSYAIQIAVGNQMALSDSYKKRTTVFNKFRQSIRRGTEELERIILNFINIISVYYNENQSML